MLGIKVNGRFLDLAPGSSSEIERKSPFFAINDYASESTSFPLAIRYTDNNAIALDLHYQYYSERQKKKYKAEHYDGNCFRGNCTLIIQTGKLNLNNIEDTEISGDIVYSISNFFQDIKDKKLSDLALGGIRSFNWTTNDPADGSNGFWQHIHESWTNNAIPYVFQPIRNKGYYGENSDIDWINKLNDQATLLYDFQSPLVPIIRIKYLLEQIFLFAGYSVDFTGLNDADWEKLLLVNLIKLDWAPPGPVTDGSGNVVIQPTPAAVIKIDLRKHVPQNKTISDFVLQLFLKYGWAPLFDPLLRKCRYVAVKEAANGQVKDWSEYAVPAISSSFDQDKKIFAFTNEIDSNDQLPSAPDLDNLKIGLPAIYARFLPQPAETEEGLVRFAYHDNQWWQVKLNDVSNQYEWKLLADNIYNDEPKGSTDTISTTISTLPCYLIEYRTEGGIAYSGYFPAMKQAYSKNIGYRTLLYHGLVEELAYNGSGAGALKHYPHASATREDPLGVNPLTWSNVIRHQQFGGTSFEQDFGIRKYWWSEFLKVLQAGEENEMIFHLPLQELTNYAWDDKILVRNIAYLVKSFVEPTPYRGVIKAIVKRLYKYVIEPVVDNSGNAVTGVFAKLTVTFLRTDVLDPFSVEHSVVKILLFSNNAGTVAYTPPADMYVYVKNEFINNAGGTPSNTTYQYYTVNAAVNTIIADATTKVSTSMGTQSENKYALDPAGASGYVVI